MHTDLLTLQHWLSPSFPVGAFAYSHGLETAIARGWVTSAESLRDWLEPLLQDGTGRADAVLIALGWQAEDAAALGEVDATARAFAASAERLQEGHLQGAAFCQTVRDIWGFDLPDLMLPVALGRAARLAGLPLEATTAMYLHAFAGNLVSAAIRLVPLGQTEGQAALAALTPLCARLAAETTGATASDLYSNAFLSDVAAMAHETLQPRIFRS
ncbi:urease accessory protein UreF [Marinovum sp.]|uniref:urease accessory protein UreF n=1 Tax=Marinovum sp. TaxID=2024839 RepID=UPI002B27B3E2|nr:urease accessory UreF family protein [Marinovum sp.]